MYPDYELHNEFDNYRTYLEKKRNVFFTPIQVVNRGIYKQSRRMQGIPEVIIYAHVEDWTGKRWIQTFEEMLAEKEDSLMWKFFFAVAGAKSCAFELLPWFIKVVKTSSRWNDGTINYYCHSYEKISES